MAIGVTCSGAECGSGGRGRKSHRHARVSGRMDGWSGWNANGRRRVDGWSSYSAVTIIVVSRSDYSGTGWRCWRTNTAGRWWNCRSRRWAGRGELSGHDGRIIGRSGRMEHGTRTDHMIDPSAGIMTAEMISSSSRRTGAATTSAGASSSRR